MSSIFRTMSRKSTNSQDVVVNSEELPYEPNFSVKNIPSKARPMQMNKDLLRYVYLQHVDSY